VVLPLAYTLVLLIEAVALVTFSRARPFTAWDPVGMNLGWAGTASMLLMHVYSLRRRVHALAGYGRLSAWLHLHIFLGLQGALLVVVHAQHLHTLWNMSGLSLLFTLIVVASGTFGRWLYAFLPKSLAGERLGARDVEKELDALGPIVTSSPVAARPEVAAALQAVATHAPLPPSTTLGAILREDLHARRARRDLDAALASARAGATDGASDGDQSALDEFAAAARRRAMLVRRLTTLTAAERLFRNWHVLHRPLAYILLGTVILHVAGHYIFAAGMSG
jgi:hypothetical protein